jgi:hypothetical protein
MNAQPRDYKVSPDSETARLLREAAASPIRVDIGETVYRGDASETKKPYDPERMIQTIYATAGALKRAGVDGEQLERDIYEDRTQRSRRLTHTVTRRVTGDSADEERVAIAYQELLDANLLPVPFPVPPSCSPAPGIAPRPRVRPSGPSAPC